MINIVETDDILEEVKKLLDLLESLKTKVMICGKPEYVDNIKNIINEYKESFSGYEFTYFSSEKFEDNDQVYLVPYEQRTKQLFINLADEEKEEEK